MKNRSDCSDIGYVSEVMWSHFGVMVSLHYGSAEIIARYCKFHPGMKISLRMSIAHIES
jgi:hypothetical protein